MHFWMLIYQPGHIFLELKPELTVCPTDSPAKTLALVQLRKYLQWRSTHDTAIAPESFFHISYGVGRCRKFHDSIQVTHPFPG